MGQCKRSVSRSTRSIGFSSTSLATRWARLSTRFVFQHFNTAVRRGSATAVFPGGTWALGHCCHDDDLHGCYGGVHVHTLGSSQTAEQLGARRNTDLYTLFASTAHSPPRHLGGERHVCRQLSRTSTVSVPTQNVCHKHRSFRRRLSIQRDVRCSFSTQSLNLRCTPTHSQATHDHSYNYPIQLLACHRQRHGALSTNSPKHPCLFQAHLQKNIAQHGTNF